MEGLYPLTMRVRISLTPTREAAIGSATVQIHIVFTEHFLSQQVETKGLISKRKVVRLGPLLSASTFLFETGAVLGRAMRDRLPAFLYPYCSGTPDNSELANFIRSQGQDVAERAPEASTVWELVMMSEMHKMDSTLPPADWSLWLLANGDREILVDEAAQAALLLMANGTGFGAEFPQRFEQVFFNSYGNVDREAWLEGHAAGFGIPEEPPAFISLDERTANDLSMFAEYCVEFYPEYVSKLGLQAYVGSAGTAPA